MTVTQLSFIAWGYAAGDRLHPGLSFVQKGVSFGLTSEPPPGPASLSAPGRVAPSWPGQTYVTGLRRQPQVGSPIAFWLDVSAPDSDEAFARAENELLPIFMAGLSTTASSPVYGTTLAVQARDS